MLSLQTWFPLAIPPHCKLVVSLLSNFENMLDRLKVLLPKEENYIEVTPLGIKLGMEVIQSWLKDCGRTLTEEQWEKVREAITKCNLPLYAQLVFGEVCMVPTKGPFTLKVCFCVCDCIPWSVSLLNVNHRCKHSRRCKLRRSVWTDLIHLLLVNCTISVLSIIYFTQFVPLCTWHDYPKLKRI